MAVQCMLNFIYNMDTGGIFYKTFFYVINPLSLLCQVTVKWKFANSIIKMPKSFMMPRVANVINFLAKIYATIGITSVKTFAIH